jgi:hypothetical protein
MSEPFAKLFDTPHGQLLVTREYDAMEGKYEIVVRGAGNGTMTPEVRLGGWDDDEEASRDALAKTDQAMAERNAAELAAMVNGLSSDAA